MRAKRSQHVRDGEESLNNKGAQEKSLKDYGLQNMRVNHDDAQDMPLQMSALICATPGCNTCRPAGELMRGDCDIDWAWITSLNTGEDGRPNDPHLITATPLTE